MKYCISQLCGDSPLKLYYISPERFNCWWILTDSSRKGCGGKIPSARQNFILTLRWFTEAPLRAVTIIHRFPVHPKQHSIFSASSTAESFRNDTEYYQLLSSSLAITAEGVCAPQFLHRPAHFWPHAPLLPSVVPAQLFMELTCKLGQWTEPELKQFYVPVWRCPPELFNLVQVPNCQLSPQHAVPNCVFPPPLCRLM